MIDDKSNVNIIVALDNKHLIPFLSVEKYVPFTSKSFSRFSTSTTLLRLGTHKEARECSSSTKFIIPKGSFWMASETVNKSLLRAE